MHNETRSLLFAFSIISLIVVTPAIADKTSAGKHFKDGILLFEKEDYAGAMVAFETSIEDFPTKMGYFNLANCYLALQEYTKAREAINALSLLFQGEFDDSWNMEILKFKDRMFSLAARLKVTVDQDGSSIRINGIEREQTPVAEPFLLAPNLYKLEVSKEGFQPAENTFTLAPGEVKTVSFMLEPIVGALMVTANEDNADVFVDGKNSGRTPLVTEVKMAPGTHSVTVTKDGFEAGRMNVEIEAGRTTSLRFELTRKIPALESIGHIPAVNESKSPGKKADSDMHRLKGWIWAGTAVTIATGLASGAFFIGAEKKADAFNEAASDFEEVSIQMAGNPEDMGLMLQQSQLYRDMQDHRDKAELFGHLGIGFAVAAAVVGTATVVTFVIDKKQSDHPAPKISVVPGGLSVLF